MKNKKVTFWVIVILLVILLPITIVGTFVKFNRTENRENPNHDMYYNGHIWFYDNNELMSKYECLNKLCEISKPTIDDEQYNINYYSSGSLENVGIINADNIKYTFITDGDEIILFNITSGSKISSFSQIKNYNTEINNNIFILKNKENKWGVIQLSNPLKSILKFEYDFIGLKSDFSEDKLNSENFIVLKNGLWSIATADDKIISNNFSNPIIDYNDKYIFVKGNDNIRIFNYKLTEYLADYNIKNYILQDNYIAIILENNILLYKDLSSEYLKSVYIENSNENYYLDIGFDNIDIKLDGKVIDSVAIN